jgi:hypothetical protein
MNELRESTCICAYFLHFLVHIIRAFFITNFKLPGTIKDLQRFLGMVNYYRRFIPHAAGAQLKLQNILSGKNKKTGVKIL